MAKHEFKEEIEKQLESLIIEGEYETARRNRESSNDAFKSYVDLLDSERGEKDYDWMSDIRLPEFPSHMLTQSSIDVGQYFQTRDFVEVYVEDETPKARAAGEAAKECINRTLNQKHLHHYLKFVRAKTINHIGGHVVAYCWWEKKMVDKVVGEEEYRVELDVDIHGYPLKEEWQWPAVKWEKRDITKQVAIIDRFNYEVLDQRNVFMDNSYVYSMQEKAWVIIRTEMTLSDILENREPGGYFNLNLLYDPRKDEDDKSDKIQPPEETETSQETYNEEGEWTAPSKSLIQPYDVLIRFGKFWCKVLERDPDTDYPTKVDPGIDDEGCPIKGAELVECIITHVKGDRKSVLIGFEPTPYLDMDGNPYKPLIRGVCYVHPTRDDGVGDGQYCREIQIAIDDTFNMSQDRVKLATLPTMKGKRQLAEEEECYIEPGHMIPLNDPNDLVEMKISDNIGGALQQIGLLKSMMQQVDAIFPTTMGGLPGAASTTATAIAGAEQRTNIRTAYKSMTFEYTFLTELYWMILNMTMSFAEPETGVKLMGKKVVDFNPRYNFFYKPLSQSIETEYSKASKVKMYITLFGYAAQMQHPDTPKLVNEILTRISELMGDEPAGIMKMALNEKAPMNPELMMPGGQPGMMGGGGGPPPGAMRPRLGAIGPMSNQSGIPMGALEGMARGV